eukprot:1368585-Amphidinium_carterae.1
MHALHGNGKGGKGKGSKAHKGKYQALPPKLPHTMPSRALKSRYISPFPQQHWPDWNHASSKMNGCSKLPRVQTCLPG